MITDPQELSTIAKAAGIKVPDNFNDFELQEFPHFVIFVTAQRGEQLPYPSAAAENAKMIAGLADDKILTVSIEDLIDMGFKFGPPTIVGIN